MGKMKEDLAELVKDVTGQNRQIKSVLELFSKSQDKLNNKENALKEKSVQKCIGPRPKSRSFRRCDSCRILRDSKSQPKFKTDSKHEESNKTKSRVVPRTNKVLHKDMTNYYLNKLKQLSSRCS